MTPGRPPAGDRRRGGRGRRRSRRSPAAGRGWRPGPSTRPGPPGRGRPPSPARSARTRRGRRRCSRRRRGVRRRRGRTAPTPKISWISSEAGPGPGVGDPEVEVHRPVVERDLVRAHGRHRRATVVAWSWPTVAAGRGRPSPPVRSLGRRAPRRVRLRAARGAHRPGPAGAPRRRPPARRPGERAARAPPRVATCPTCCGAGDLLVVNETRVIPARLRLHRATGGAAEVLLLEPLRPGPADLGGARAARPPPARRRAAARRRRRHRRRGRGAHRGR